MDGHSIGDYVNVEGFYQVFRVTSWRKKYQFGSKSTPTLNGKLLCNLPKFCTFWDLYNSLKNYEKVMPKWCKWEIYKITYFARLWHFCNTFCDSLRGILAQKAQQNGWNRIFRSAGVKILFSQLSRKIKTLRSSCHP